MVRGEYMFEPSRPGSSYSFLGIGLTTFVDAEVESDQLKNERDFTSLNLDFNVNAPLPGIAPGLSFGILDVTDQSPDRRRGYVAMSFQDTGGGSDLLSGGAAVETTIGTYIGHESHAFVGVSLPVNDEFRLMVEDNGTVISSGAEYKPPKGPYFRLVFRTTHTLLSVGTTVHF